MTASYEDENEAILVNVYTFIIDIKHQIQYFTINERREYHY